MQTTRFQCRLATRSGGPRFRHNCISEALQSPEDQTRSFSLEALTSLGSREELVQFYQHFSETCRRHQSMLGRSRPSGRTALLNPHGYFCFRRHSHLRFCSRRRRATKLNSSPTITSQKQLWGNSQPRTEAGTLGGLEEQTSALASPRVSPPSPAPELWGKT